MEIEYLFQNNLLDKNFTLKYGQYILLKIWKSLGLDTEFKKIQKEIGAKYSVNNAAFLMTFMRTLYPKIDFEKIIDQNNAFVGASQGEIELVNLVDGYKKLMPYKDRLLTVINKKLDSEFGKQRTKTIFYDIIPSDFYMLPRDTLEKVRIHNLEGLSEGMKALAKECQSAGALPKECLDEKGNIVVEKLPEWFYELMEPDRVPYFYGKQERVWLGLAFDGNGLPLDFEIYQGNFSELEKLKEFAEKLKKTYKAKQVVRVVNPVLKVKPNLLELVKEGFGFLVTQKITKLSPEQMAWVYAPEGYDFINPKRPDEGKYKVLMDWVRPAEKGQSPVTCNLVGVFNTQGKRLYLEILKVRAEMQEDAVKKAKIEEISKLIGAPKFKKSGLPVKARPDKWNVSDFNAIAYNFGGPQGSHSQKDGTTSTATDAIQAVRMYRTMNQMRTYLRTITDDVYFTNPGILTFSDTQAHFFTCLLSLLLLRVLQIRTQQKSGFSISIKQIVETLDYAALSVWVLKNGLMPHFMFFDRPPYGLVKGWVAPSREIASLLIKAGVAGRSPLKEITNAVDIWTSGALLDIKQLALLFGTSFRTLQDVIPKPYLSYFEVSKSPKESK